MEAQQTIIIEASQQNSVEAPTTSNYSAWTNRIEPTLLRKGDYITLNTSIVSQRGASGQSNIEFTDEYNNATDNLQSNFSLMKIGFYLCNNNVNSCPMPFKYAKRQADNSNPAKKTDGSGRVRTLYDTDRFVEIDGRNVVNNSYLLGVWRDPFRTPSDMTPNDYTCDALSSFENRNPSIKIDGARFAKVGNDFNGWERGNSGSRLGTTADLLTQDIPLHIEKGFKDARSVGQTLTRTLQTTNEPYSSDAEYAVPRSTLYTITPTEDAQTQNNPRFNGYCMKTIGANLQKYDSSVTNPLYNNLCVKKPYRWKYGTQLLSNTYTNPILNNARMNSNYLTIKRYTRTDYPVLLWSSWNVANPTTEAEVENLDNYNFYSPHFTDAQKADEGGDNVLEWSGFVGVMSGYNDYYPEIVDYDDDEEFQHGQMLFKNGLNSYYIYNPPNASHTPTDKNFRAFMDDDNVAFDRITGWSAKNALGSDEWYATGMDLAREVEQADFYTTYQFTEANFFQIPIPYNYFSWQIVGQIGGTSGNKYMYDIVTPPIEEGKTYTISFKTTYVEGSGSSSAYEHAIGIVDRTATFGMSAMNITSDGTYTQKFTATATYAGTNGIMFYYNHGVPYEMVVLVSEFDFAEVSLQGDDEYTITDIFHQPATGTQNTTKIYKMQINSLQLRNEKINITGSSLGGGVFNRQYTPYGNMRGYKSGSNIVAFSGSYNDYPNAVLLLNQDDPNYDYVIFNQYGNKYWRMAEITKFTGGEIVSGTVLGSIVGWYNDCKDPFRTGQQYFNYEGIWENRTKPIYDYSSGNDWTNATPGGYSSLRFFPTSGTSTNPDIGYYDGYWTNPLNLPQRVYYRYDPQGDTTAISGTAYYIGDPVPYQRQWSFDINTGLNGTFTQIFTDGSSATYTPSGALTTSYTPYSITSHIADPLPVIDTDKEYFASVVYDGITYYLGANHNGNGDDTDKEGKRGRLIYSTDGGVTYTTATWDWNGADIIDMDGDGGNIPLTETGGTPTLTNIIEYETGETITLGATPYTFPIDGKQYGITGVDIGTTEKVVDLHNPLLPENDVNNLYLSIGDMTDFDNGYQSGKVYKTQEEAVQANAIADWRVIFNTGDGTCDIRFTDINTGIFLFQLSNLSANVTRYGWVLFKSSKYDKLAEDPDQTLTVQDGEDYYTGSRSLSTTGDNGKYIPDGTYNFPHSTGTSEFLEDENLDTTHANMPKHTLLMTNIDYNLYNLEIVKNYFRYTEIYGGDVESSRADIANDIEKFYTTFQLGRTDDNALGVDQTTAPYNNDEPNFQYYMRDYGKMGTDDSDVVQFTDPDGHQRKGSNKNFGNICPTMTTKTGHRQELEVFTRWKGKYTSRLITTNRLSNNMNDATWFETSGRLYGKEISEDDFQTNYPDEYAFVTDNNVGVYPYLLKNEADDGTISYTLAMGFETYRNIDRDSANLLKTQDLTWFGFSPSFLDNDYITPINTDTPYLTGNQPTLGGGLYGYTPNFIQQYNMNLINIGSAPVCQYDPDLNRFQFNYFHTPFKFNEVTGVDADLGEEVAFLNSDTLMIMGQGISENNLQSGGQIIPTPVLPTPVHLGLADAQCGIFLIDTYGQTPSQSFITSSNDGTKMTRNNYDNTLFYTLGFSYYDLKPIRFTEDSFNNRFNPNTYNTISGAFRQLGTSPFTTNSSVNIADQIKTNIYTGVNLHRTYSDDSPYMEEPQLTANTNEGTPSFYLGYNSLLSATIKTASANMTSRSVIVQLQAPFYRVYCDLPLDTMSYLTDGSLSCVGYMTKNYQSQSYIYSFASDYGGYLTRDVLITNLRTEIRNPKGLLVSSLDPNSTIFYKVVRNIQIQNGLTPKQMEKQEKLLLEQELQRQQEESQIQTISANVNQFIKTLPQKSKVKIKQESSKVKIKQESSNQFIKTLPQKSKVKIKQESSNQFIKTLPQKSKVKIKQESSKVKIEQESSKVK